VESRGGASVPLPRSLPDPGATAVESRGRASSHSGGQLGPQALTR